MIRAMFFRSDRIAGPRQTVVALMLLAGIATVLVAVAFGVRA